MKATEHCTFLWSCLLFCTRWFSFWVCEWNSKVWPFKWKLLSSTFLWCCLLCCTRWFSFESVDEIRKCHHSNESYWAVLSCGAVYSALQGGSSFESVDEILKCDHSNESYWAVLSCGVVYCAVQGGSNLCVREWNPKVWRFTWKGQNENEILKCNSLHRSHALSSTFPNCLFLY